MRDVTEKALRLITYSQELGLDLKTEEDRQVVSGFDPFCKEDFL